LLVGLNELLKAQLNCFKSFALPAASQIFPSLFAMGGVLMLSNHLGVAGLAIGWVSGVVLQTGLLLVSNFRHGIRLHVDFNSSVAPIRNLVLLSLPYTAVALMPWALLLIDQNLASRLGPGSISVLGYADKIFRLPLTVLIAAIYTGLHPYLAEAAATKRFDDFQKLVERMTRITLFILLPVGLMIILLRQPIVVMVYQRGAFTASATNATTGVLLYLGLQVPSLGIWYVYDRALVCLGRTSYLMGLAIFLVFVKFVGSIALVPLLGLAGLACATLIATFASALVMHVATYRLLGRTGLSLPSAPIIKIVASALAAALASALAWSWVAQGPQWVATPAAHAAFVLAAMACLYLGFTAVLNRGQLRETWRARQ